MHTKGSAFLARRDLVVRDIGEARWEAFLREFAETEPVFAQPMLVSTKIPIEPFLALSDAIVATFYGGDPQAHWRFGEASAEWAFAQGPYQKYFRSEGFEAFIESTPMLWKAYYDDGRLLAAWHEQEAYADVRIVELPVMHVHFEYNVMAFARRGLELTGGGVREVRPLRGVTTGGTEIHYQFYMEPSASGQAQQPSNT